MSIHRPLRIAQTYHIVLVLPLIAGLSACLAAHDDQPPIPRLLRKPVVPAGEQISEYIREVFQDRDGVYWFGTNGDGVARYDGESLTYLSLKQGFGGKAVRGIVQDATGALWFATDGGVSRYERDKFINYTVANGLSDNSVWSIMRDTSDAIWVGTHEGVCRLDGKSFVPFPLPRIKVENPESRFSPKVVFAMFQDPAGNIWFGTDGEGVHKYDGRTFTSFTTQDGLAGNMVRSIRGDRHGRIWIGTNGGGVSCYDGKTFRNFTQKDGLSNDRVYEILEDRAGNMWFSTLGAGACRYDGKSFTAFGVEKGLESLHPYSVPTNIHVQEFFEDKDGVIWLGCSGGLFYFDGKKFINVTRNGPWPASAQKINSGQSDNPMAYFARMMPSEWRVTYESGKGQFDQWRWGPGRHSTFTQTYGADGGANPWREVQIIYWHPGRKQIGLLTLHRDVPGIGRGVGQGLITLSGNTLHGTYDLHQSENPNKRIRKMGLRWIFDGPDRYRETLLEDSGSGLTTLAEWDYARATALAQLPAIDVKDSTPPEQMRVFESLLNHEWESRGGRAGRNALRLQTTLEWIPFVEAIYARTVALSKEGEPIPVLDAFVYQHPRTGKLRCLALSNSGGVFDGSVSVPEDGGLEFDLKGYEGDEVFRRVMRLDLEKDATVRNRVWSIEGDKRTSLLDILHRRLDPREGQP